METKNDDIILKDDFQKKKLRQLLMNTSLLTKIFIFIVFVVNYRIFQIKAKRGLFHINEWHEQISYSNVSYKV